MKYFLDMFACLILLKIVLSKNKHCQQISSMNGENLTEQKKNYFIESDGREVEREINDFIYSKKLAQIIKKYPLNINTGQIMDFKIFIDLEKQFFRFSILYINQSFIQISNTQNINNDLFEQNFLNQTKLITLTTNQIGNSDQCNLFDEIQPYYYYIYCFYDTLLKIYTINQDSQVSLYFEYNFTDYDIDSKKSIRYKKNQNIIVVIIYNREKCETFKIDKKKEIKRILEINKNTHKFEEILTIQFYQDNFLQIYFDNDSIMFDILECQLQANNELSFVSELPKINAYYTIQISNQQQEKYFMDISRKSIILNSKYEIPQFLIFSSKLILLYSDCIEIIEGGIIRQTLNEQTKTLQSLFQNYLIGLDNQNNVIIVKLNYLSQNYRTYFVNDIPLILNLYQIYLFSSYSYEGCFEVNLITYEQKEYEKKQKFSHFLKQTHFYNVLLYDNHFMLSNSKISNSFSFYFQLCDNKELEIQTKNSKKLPQQIHNYIDLNEYFYYYGKKLIIQCQQNNLVIISNGNQVERFRLSCDSSYGSIVKLNYNDRFCVLTKDHFGIFQFLVRFHNNFDYNIVYEGQINLTNYVTKIDHSGLHLIAYHQNSTISLFSNQMTFLGIKYLFIGKEMESYQIINIIDNNNIKWLVFYEQNIVLITNYKDISLTKKYNQSFFCLFFNNVQKIYICVHKFLNILYIYELQYDDLVEISEFTLFNFKIKRPIDYKSNLNIISIVCTQDEQLYLLSFTLQNNNMLELSRITPIFNLNYALDDDVLAYVTNNNQLEYLPFYLFEFKLHRQLPAQSNKKTFTLLVEFVENQTQIFSNLTLELEIDLKVSYPQLLENHSKSLVYKMGEKNELKIENFVFGPIEYIKLLNQQQALLISPHVVLLNQTDKCQQRINGLCLYNDHFQFLLVYNELQNISYNTNLQIKVCNVFIAYFDIQNTLIIIVRPLNDGYLEFYYGNKKKAHFSMNGIIQSYVLMDYFLLIKSNFNQMIVRCYKGEFITKIQKFKDFQLTQISLTQETCYISLAKISNLEFEINSTIIRNNDQEIIQTFLLYFNNQPFQTCYGNIAHSLNFTIFQGSYNQISFIFQIQIGLFSSINSAICTLQFSQQSIIKLELVGMVFYPINEEYLSVLFQDNNYLIVQFTNSAQLYQIKDHNLNKYYPVFQFNQHNILFQEQNFSFCQPQEFNILYSNYFKLIGEYELLAEQENHNQTLEFMASYKESKIRFNIILLIEDNQALNSDNQFNLTLIFIIVLLCFLLLAYCFLNKKKKAKNLNQNNLEIELKKGEETILQR